ncbi:MAG: type IV pili twitching motility protein PilT, partial [Actinomycetes bacterium]
MKNEMANPWLDHCLRALADAGGSDLHLKVGSPPRIRVNGILGFLPGQPAVTRQQSEELAVAIAGPGGMGGASEVDCAYTVDGLGRFRVNLFRQRGSVAVVARRVLTTVP